MEKKIEIIFTTKKKEKKIIVFKFLTPIKILYVLNFIPNDQLF